MLAMDLNNLLPDKFDKKFLPGIRFHSINDESDGYKTCVWPSDLMPCSLVGHIVVIDGSLVEIMSYETKYPDNEIKKGKIVFFTTKRYQSPIDYDDLM